MEPTLEHQVYVERFRRFDLIRRHTAKHRVGPRREFAALLLILSDFVRHTEGLNVVALHESLAPQNGVEVYRAQYYERHYRDDVRDKSL